MSNAAVAAAVAPEAPADPRLGRVVVVGAGQAAGDLVGALRGNGHLGPVVVVGDEDHVPYSRPPLSKAYFAGVVGIADLYLRTEADYLAHDVAVLTGSRVLEIDREAQHVRLDDGTELPYDTLVLATGGRPRTLTHPGLEGAGNLHYLRTMADVDAMKLRCQADARLVIIGGGFIGLEVAAAARAAGVDVVLLEASDRVLSRVAGPEVSDFFARVHREEGVDIRLQARTAGFEFGETGDITAVLLESGERIEADLVLAGIGLVPNSELAADAGLTVDGGVVVDEFCRTSDPRILAIGDCTVHPDPQRGVPRRLESISNATEQARVAALSILGTPEPYTAIPWFWSDQYEVKLKVAGLSTGYTDVVLRGDSTQGRSFSAFYLRDGVLIAADVVSNPREFAVARQLVNRQASVEPGLLADTAVPLKSLLQSLET